MIFNFNKMIGLQNYGDLAMCVCLVGESYMGIEGSESIREAFRHGHANNPGLA